MLTKTRKSWERPWSEVTPEAVYRSRREFIQTAAAGAIGLTQVMPSTAFWLDPSVRYDDLFRGETNLRLGFRYLNQMIRQYHGQLDLALLAYNRGPQRVKDILAAGGDPSNGYASAVMGVKRKPTVQPAAVVTPPDSAAAPSPGAAGSPEPTAG